MLGAETTDKYSSPEAKKRKVSQLISPAQRAVGNRVVPAGGVDYRPGTGRPGGIVRPPRRQAPAFIPDRSVRNGGSKPFLTGLARVISPIVGVDPSSLTSSYGPRTHPITGRHSNHTGIDLSSPAGTPVIAPANAVLERLTRGDSIYGNQLILGHGREEETMYGHLSEFAEGLKPGSKIKRGDVIGYVGSTGLSTGNHLHWETWRNSQPTNPMTFIGGS